MSPRLRKYVRRRQSSTRLIVIVSVFVCSYCGLFATFLPKDGIANTSQHEAGLELDGRTMRRNLLQTAESSSNATTNADYPADAFTMEQLKRGAVVVYIVGVIYMFVALAIVCDEFFVPSLEVIIEKLVISEDVAGATFMAAGGSAPELFTSFIGVFVSHSDVGIGTIVGSAVFNILFVIGMCAIVSKTVLQLTWWPLFRDISFYSISLVLLIVFFADARIYYWEAIILLCCYLAYVIFMKFNASIEFWFKSKIARNRVTVTVPGSDNLMAAMTTVPPPGTQPHLTPRYSFSTLKSGSNKFHHGLLQLMIHTIDPLGEVKVHEKAIELHAIASLTVLMNNENHNTMDAENQNGGRRQAAQVSTGSTEQAANCTVPSISNGKIHNNDSTNSRSRLTFNHNATGQETPTQHQPEVITVAMPAATRGSPGEDPDEISHNADGNQLQGTLTDASDALDISWPDTWRKRITYILVVPIIFPLWATLPDVRRLDRRKYFAWTFIGSIVWIAAYSYLMNWWADTTGRTFGIPDSVMGLTFLAAGTSIPDLLTSVIVAKKGFGDMSVSSSVGSNLFDVTVGLPLPWLMYTIIFNEVYVVDSTGMLCSIILLFAILILVIITIIVFKWRMHRPMGYVMFVLYLIFVAISLLLQLEYITCPSLVG